MTRTRTVRSSKPRRRLATTLAAGGLAVFGVAAALPTPASASGLSTTISQWASADLTLNDAAKTTVTVAAGVDENGVIGRRLTKTQTVSVNLHQSRCTVNGGQDVLVSRDLAAEQVVGGGVSVSPLFGVASVKGTVAVSGTETRTPAGTGGDCNEPNPAAATTAPISDSVKLDVSWRNKPGSSPLAWSDIYQQGVFYYRDAVGSGTVTSATTGAARAKDSANGWLWSGAWVYATGT